MPAGVLNAITEFFGFQWATPGMMGMIESEIVNGADPDLIVQAIQATAAQGKKSWPYAKRIYARLEMERMQNSRAKATWAGAVEDEEGAPGRRISDEEMAERSVIQRRLIAGLITKEEMHTRLEEIRQRYEGKEGDADGK